MTAIELLRQDVQQERIYRSRSVYIDWLRDYIDEFKEAYPDQDWDSCCRLVAEVPRQSYDIAVKHLVKWGDGDASVLEKRWHIQLPEWVHRFYSEVQTAVLGWRNLFYILHPDRIIEVEEEHREWHGNKHLPVRLIRFAEVWLSGDYFAFRQSVRDNQWRIMYVSHEESTAYFQDASLDGADDDEDIDKWMSRMIKTDGHPALRDNEDFEKPFMERIG